MHQIPTQTTRSVNWRTLCNLAFLAFVFAPCMAMAAGGGGTFSPGGATCTLLTTVQTALNGISILVVTIAIIFSGYQIAFAHKRIAEVAPIFIGAILIGAAGQLATMLLSSSAGSGLCS
jgi:type IV secretion system protein VirB2